ncbi:MAG TPA: hypothetical protein GX524_06805, partial [Firmicutes bacterium]|nr:hypothetical protein [Bacillota bacterium]
MITVTGARDIVIFKSMMKVIHMARNMKAGMVCMFMTQGIRAALTHTIVGMSAAA